MSLVCLLLFLKEHVYLTKSMLWSRQYYFQYLVARVECSVYIVIKKPTSKQLFLYLFNLHLYVTCYIGNNYGFQSPRKQTKLVEWRTYHFEGSNISSAKHVMGIWNHSKITKSLKIKTKDRRMTSHVYHPVVSTHWYSTNNPPVKNLNWRWCLAYT